MLLYVAIEHELSVLWPGTDFCWSQCAVLPCFHQYFHSTVTDMFVNGDHAVVRMADGSWQMCEVTWKTANDGVARTIPNSHRATLSEAVEAYKAS